MKSMRNQHIKNLGEVIPIEIRLDVYKRALPFHESGGTEGLCLHLPAVLWGLDECEWTTPNGEIWIWTDTRLAFPELTQTVLNGIRETFITDRPSVRADYLRKWIRNLTKEINGNSNIKND